MLNLVGLAVALELETQGPVWEPCRAAVQFDAVRLELEARLIQDVVGNDLRDRNSFRYGLLQRPSSFT